MSSHEIRRTNGSDRTGDPEDPQGDRDLLAVLLLFWAISLARVVIGVLGGETFGTEGTLAFLAVVIVPWLMWDTSRPVGRSASARVRVDSSRHS